MKEIILSDGTKVEMRKPKVRDMRAVDNITNEMEREIKLFANLTGLSVDKIEDMYMDDYAKLQEAYLGLVSGE